MKKKTRNYMKDMFGKEFENGHIAAVRYVWNSYVGVIRPFRGFTSEGARRFAFFSPHPIEQNKTYQILGHVSKDHKDFNEEVFNSYHNEEGECPVKIEVYRDFAKETEEFLKNK